MPSVKDAMMNNPEAANSRSPFCALKNLLVSTQISKGTHAMRLGIADHLVERLHHNGLQLIVDHRFLPEISLAVLYPLEIACGHAAGVGQDVGDHEDFLVSQHLVGGCGGRTVRAFRDDLR